VSRWEPDASERLERAAIELFLEQGFAQTSVPQITARAGLTTRTFFRHFADKREVLFAGEEAVPELIRRLMAEAPAELEPMALISAGLLTMAETMVAGRGEDLRTRREVVASDEGLRERELRKLAAMAEAIAAGFEARGCDELTAVLAARTAVTAFNVGVDRWLRADHEQPLGELVQDTLKALRSLTAEPLEPPGRRP
jgi:AcrR family transcriptional regulator